MAEADTLQHRLLEAQNSDGGWGYQNGSSWTEPTALALLALAANLNSGPACLAGQKWLIGSQKADGGWAPQPSVEQSTWVTSLATLALSGTKSSPHVHRRGTSWLLGQILPEDSPVGRFVSRLQGVPSDSRPAGGSPWFPGTAAWISPTALSVLTLSNHAATNNDPWLRSQLDESRKFILSRRCRDGGWNHGGAKYRSDSASSYPETTGMALLALQGVEPSKVIFPLERAVAFVSAPTSVEGLSWLQLGLLAHGRDHRAIQTNLPCRTARDAALRLLALAGNCSANKLFTT